MAGELAEAEGIQTDYVVTNDDVAVEDSTYTSGRRGIAGTIFVHKICGAAADDGKDLAGIKELAERVNSNVRSMGMALTSCTPPESGEPIFDIGDDEIDRKSTRLNSSHANISYAVFCLKKKKKHLLLISRIFTLY